MPNANWKNGATPHRFAWQYFRFQRQYARLIAPMAADGVLLRRPNHAPNSPNFTWPNGTSPIPCSSLFVVVHSHFNFGERRKKYEIYIRIKSLVPFNTFMLCNVKTQVGLNDRRRCAMNISMKSNRFEWNWKITFSVETWRIVWSVHFWIIFNWIIADSHFFYATKTKFSATEFDFNTVIESAECEKIRKKNRMVVFCRRIALTNVKLVSSSMSPGSLTIISWTCDVYCERHIFFCQ